MSDQWHKCGGSSRQWAKTKNAVLLANRMDTNSKGQCQLHISGICEGLATTAHHTHGRCVTGDDPRYLIATCIACNLHVGAPSRQIDPLSNPRKHLH